MATDNTELMDDDMAIDLWLSSLNDEVNETLACDGKSDVSDLLTQRYSILKRLASAPSVVTDEQIEELAAQFKIAEVDRVLWHGDYVYNASINNEQLIAFTRALPSQTAAPAVDADAARLEYVYQVTAVKPFIAPITTKEKWLANIDAAIAAQKVRT